MNATFRIVTWNVNSLRVRLPWLLHYLNSHRPDILAIQETKVEDQHFPIQAIKELGYHCAFAGQKAYNGVAVFSSTPFLSICADLPDFPDSQRRVLRVSLPQLQLINIYAPNGAQLNSDQYCYKLQWFDQLHDYLERIRQPHWPLVLVGDFNIAPEDQDVYDPQAVRDQVLISPPERAAFQRLLQLGLHDSFRLFNQNHGAYTWWDYRARAFQRNLGLRIDHILVSESLLSKCMACEIDKTLRGTERPSDHAPVILTMTTL